MRWQEDLEPENMTRLEKLEREVEKLSHDEIAAFRRWFHKYDSDHWDGQIEIDARTGKLDALAQEAISAHRNGRTKGL